MLEVVEGYWRLLTVGGVVEGWLMLLEVVKGCWGLLNVDGWLRLFNVVGGC